MRRTRFLLVSLVSMTLVMPLVGCRGSQKKTPDPVVAAPAPPPPSLHATDGKKTWDIRDTTLIEHIARRLKDLGIYTGPVDGAYRPELEVALKQFQAARGLPATGTLDPLTADSLGVRFADSLAKGSTAPPDAGTAMPRAATAPEQDPQRVSGRDPALPRLELPARPEENPNRTPKPGI